MVESQNESAQSANPFEDQSPKLLPRVSISNIKSPSKRQSIASKALTQNQTHILDWLHEVKQFVSFINIHFYYSRSISDSESLLKSRYARLHQTLITLEPKRVQPIQQQQQQARGPISLRSGSTVSSAQKGVNATTGAADASLAVSNKIQTLVQELIELFRETIGRSDLPSNILKGALRTVRKLLEYKGSFVQMLKQCALPTNAEIESGRHGFKPGLFLKTLFECQFDTHDTYQEEIILLTIQKIVIQMTKHFSDAMKADELFKNCVYFFRVLKKRTINDRQITSLHMQEGTKQNMNKLFAILMSKDERAVAQSDTAQVSGDSQPVASSELHATPQQQAEKYKGLKRQVFHLFARKLVKNIAKMNESLKEQATLELVGLKREYVCFIVKAFTESFQALSRHSVTQQEVKDFINEEKEILFQVMCKAGEFKDIAVRNMAQILFSQVLQQVLDLGVPFREELEVLFVKLLLKPLEQLDKKLMKGLSGADQSQSGANKDRMQQISTAAQSSIGEVSFLSDDEDNSAGDNRIVGNAAASSTPTSYDQSDQFELEASLNLLVDTLLTLQPEQFAQIFLVYDCQPLSENLIRRSLFLLLRHTQLQGRQTDLSKTFSVIGLIMQGLLRYEVPPQASQPQNFAQSIRGMQNILDMLAQKKKVRNIAMQANVKPKAFFGAIEEAFEGVNQTQMCKIASKVLLNSRRVSLDKIAEIIGGKDDRAKECLMEYLERQDYADCDLEKSMRGFLQTFRMAGVDSQVVFNILEKFGHTYFEKDFKQMFTSGEEAYNFAYLIIVLQTCQHNAAIKEKTSLERFFGQAKEMVPESYDQLPEGMVEAVFHKITQREIKAPVTRDLYGGEYELSCGQQEIFYRMVKASDPGEGPLSEADFLSTSDLRERQLFDMHNRILGVAPEQLQQAALRQIVNILTAKFVQIRQKVGDSRFNTVRTLELTKQLIQTNAHFQNNDWVDRLILDMDRQVDQFCRISKLESDRKTQVKADLQGLFWSNFKVLRLATGLIPKMAPSMSRCSIHYASFNAVEVKIRNKFSKEIPATGLVTRMLSDSRQYQSDWDDSKTPMTISPLKQGTQVTSNDAKKGPGGAGHAPVSTPRAQSGIFNMVYNYFTPVPSEAEEEAKKRDYIMSGQNQIDLLKHQLDDFNEQTGQGSQSNENVDESHFLDFVVVKEIDICDALQQIAQFIRENLSSRKASLCLSYLFRVYLDSRAYQDTERGIIVQQTILALCQSFVHQITNRANQSSSPTLGASGTHSRSLSYGNIALSTQEEILSDSLDDSISQKSDSTANEFQFGARGGSQRNLAKLLLKEPKRNQFESEITTWVNKHLALELYFSVAGMSIVKEMTSHGTSDEIFQPVLKAGPKTNELIKDVQKTLLALNEDELTREDFETAFLYQKVAQFIKPQKLTVDDLNKTGGLDDDDEDDEDDQFDSSPAAQKEEQKQVMRPLDDSDDVEVMLPLRDYPKIRKFLHLLFILMIQQSTASKTVCNSDQLQVALSRLIRAISDMFLLQETVPYDQINRSLDVLVKCSEPFDKFHELSAEHLEDLLAICQTFFQLLERGSDGQAQKLFQQGQFDLWFKTMTLMIQKILLSPYIELYKSIQERTCTLVKIQILTFQFQPLTTSSADSASALQAKTYTKLIFEELIFTLNIAALQNQREWLKQRAAESQIVHSWTQSFKRQWEDHHEGFARLCQLCANTLTDVFIQYAQQLSQEQAHSGASFEMFSILWNKFMLVLLNYADSTESLLIEEAEVFPSVQPLQQSIQHNIQRVIEFLLSQGLLLEKAGAGQEGDELVAAKVQLYQKTKAALGLFWQEVHLKQTPGQ